MNFKKAAATLIFLLLIAACNSKEESTQPKSCLENMPETISGLRVKGTRSEKNVTKNMWPIVCRAREVYRQRLLENPKIKEGKVELELLVEFNGEIGPYRIVRSTLGDPVFEKQIMALFEFVDFDPYGPQNSESEILLPLHFEL